MTWLSEQIEKCVVLFVAKQRCSDCDTAKEFCLKAGFTESEITIHEVGIRGDGAEILAEAGKLSNITSSPVIWVRGKVLGGVEDARQAWFDGSLPKAKYDMILEQAAREMVAHSATTNTLVVFSKKTCPPCTEVKIMLEEAGFTKEQTNVITISDWPTMDHIQEHCRQITGERWTPRVWINGKAMGGIKEIKPMFESEDLHVLAESLAGKSGPVKL